jgi:hypothetical protein
MTVAAQTTLQFRMGLVLDDAVASKSVHDFVQWAQAHERLQITHLILTSAKRSAGMDVSAFHPSLNNELPSVFAKFLFRIVVAIERLFLLKNERYHNHLHTFELTPLVANTVRLSPVSQPSGIRTYSSDDIDLIKALNLDLLVTFENDALDADILNAAKLGAVSVCYGNDGVQHGGPAGFWEVYFRDDTTGFAVQRFTGDAGAQTLFCGRVGTQFYFLLNRAALCEKANYYLEKLVERLADGGESTGALPGVPPSNRPYNYPKCHQTLVYLVRLFWWVAAKVARKAFSIDYRWNVAFVYAGWRDAVLWRTVVKKFKNPSRRYLADPFLISKDNKNFCFVEDYDIIKGRGRISAYEIKGGRVVFLGVALNEGFHLSFPYLFEHRGELYMCPESSGNRDIRIYKCIDFPLGWKLEQIIMKDVSAVDTMLFEKDGKWWLLTNIDPAQLDDFQLELCIFSANSPFDDEWAPHPRNPIFVDASRARNGGLIKEGDRLFRVAQNQGFDFYGKSISVNEIIRLDDSNYIEERVCAVTPTFQRGIAGTHHLHSDGKLTVFDFARLGRPS